MTINIYTPLEVTDGTYNARITDISEIASRKFKGDSKCLFKFEPYRGDRIYEEVLLWIGDKCSTNSVEFQLLQTLGVTGTKVTVEKLKKNFLNSNIGLEIKDNASKDGRIFHNIVSFFAVRDDFEDDFYEEDGFADEDEDFADEDEDFADEDEEDSFEDEDEEDETYSDSDDDTPEEADSFDHKDSESGMDVLEDDSVKPAKTSSRRNRNNRRNRRR